jgi:hypothetical protein
MQEMASSLASADGSQFVRSDAVRWFEDNYPKVKRATVTAHLIRMSTNAPSRLHHNIKPDDDLLFQVDRNTFRRYSPQSDPAPIHDEQHVSATGDSDDDIPTDSGVSDEFAYEKDLQNYLSKNLCLIADGLSLYEDEGISGIEFPVGGRYIDILALDADNNFVVIELKVSRGYDRVVGQLMRYMAWIRKNLADSNQSVSGVILARNISEDLTLACSELKNVQLYEHELSLTLTEIPMAIVG